MATVVGVHGIWNYRYFRTAGAPEAAAAALQKDWTNWLSAGLEEAGRAGERVPVRAGYYSHHLHRGTAQGAENVAMLDEDAQDMLVSWVELLQPVASVPQGPRTARARSAADWLTRNYGEAARVFATVFVREVSTYLKEPAGRRRASAREAVAAAIRAASDDEPVTVIAHSLGSVVAYEALWADPGLRVDHLITLGSPLGMPGIVFERLQPAPRADRGARPPGVSRWTNLADVGDIVAIPRQGLSHGFDGVDVDNPALTIAKWDFHTVKSYLTCPDVAALCV